jgi:hypothetical protein
VIDVDRFTWGLAAGAVLLVVAAVLAVTLVQSRQDAPDLSRPEGVVTAYLNALRTRHPEVAWDLLSTSAQAGTTRESFIDRATTFRPDSQERVTVDRVDLQGDTAYVTIGRTSGGGGIFSAPYTSETTVRLVREDGRWRIAVPPDVYLISPPPVPATRPTGPPAGTATSAPAGTATSAPAATS